MEGLEKKKIKKKEQKKKRAVNNDRLEMGTHDTTLESMGLGVLLY